MTNAVAVPEKVLEHWSSQYLMYRYQTHVSQWWPTRGQDIDVRKLPPEPGKAVQIELKTATPGARGIQEVRVDLDQLRKYSRKPLEQQPFYAFPRPHWDGDLETEAAKAGFDATDLAFSRKGTNDIWWFAAWMVVLTTRQVAGILHQEQGRYLRGEHGPTAPLVRFDVKNDSSATWGDLNSPAPDREAVGWPDLWTELESCGRPGWPQLFRVPAGTTNRLGSLFPQPGDKRAYSRDDVTRMFQESADASLWRGDDARLVTLAADARGEFRVIRDPAPDPDLPDQADVGDSGPDDNRLLVFVPSRMLHR